MPGLEHLQLGRLILERRRRTVNRPALGRLNRAIREVHRLAEHVHDAPERRRTDWHRDRRARVDRAHAALHPVRRLHRHRTHPVLAQVLFDLDDDVDRPGSLADNADGVVDRRKMAAFELDVDDRADHLNDSTDCLICCCCHV